MHVHLLRAPKPQHLAVLTDTLDQGIKLTMGEVSGENSEATILVAGRPDQRLIQAFPDLTTLIVPWIGIPPETLQVVQEYPDLSLHNLHHNADPTAEMAVALLLAAAKRIIPFDQSLRSNDWSLRYQDPETILLAGKNALILGYGEVGRRIGTALRGLGLRVKTIRRRAETDPDLEVYPITELDSLLPAADFLILALLLTQASEGMIGEKQLRLLPESAVLVNVGRGKIVEEAALFQALQEKWIFGAGLDVWFDYPGSPNERSQTAPGKFPWGSLDNLVLSPHRAGLVRETEELRMKALADLLNRAARGLPIPNLVDRNLGY